MQGMLWMRQIRHTVTKRRVAQIQAGGRLRIIAGAAGGGMNPKFFPVSI
jgi:hypothetical protein